MKKLKDFKEGQKVKYTGDNKAQQGEHTILSIDSTGLYLNSNYRNAKYYIIDKYNLDKVKVKEGGKYE